MLRLVDHVLLVLIVVGLALRAWFGMRALRALPPERLAEMRPRFWARAIATQWLLVLSLGAWWLVRGRPGAWLGLVPRLGWGFAGVMMGVVVMAFALLAQRRAIATNPDIRARLRLRLANVAPILPGRRAEWPGFASLAITAGICEELLFRGFVTWWLAHLLPVFWMAIVAQAVLFGLAHAYQGPRGVLATGAVGLFMGGVVWVSGSVWAAMILHSLIDLQAGDTALTVFEADAVPPSARA
jgi:membrane protease YdiL (CAAX protease family)